MGLFWSMYNDEGPGSRTRFANNSLEPIEVVIQLELDGEVVDQQRLVRQRILPNVTRREIRESGLVGTLFIPKADDPVSAIMLLGGSEGGLTENKAALLASHGYATLALAYFHLESLPQELVEIPLEYFETAIHFLGKQDAVDSRRIAVQGGSRGGELALLLGSTFPQIRAVVAYASGGLVWGGCCSPEAMKKPAWTYKGEPITPLVSNDEDPAIRALIAEREASISAGRPVAFVHETRLEIETATNVDVATIPVESTQGPILLISGKADDLWPSTELAEISMRRLRRHNFPFRFTHLSYRDAGHSFGTPFQPTTVSESKHPLDAVIIQLGGTPVGNARASVDSWNQVLDFYREMLDLSKD
jgi:dienelactone hydrolase